MELGAERLGDGGLEGEVEGGQKEEGGVEREEEEQGGVEGEDGGRQTTADWLISKFCSLTSGRRMRRKED